MNIRDNLRLRYMLEVAQEALEFCQGATREDLDSNRMLACALVHCLHTIGEVTRHVSPETRQENPAIPWLDIDNMRNRLAQVDPYVDKDLVWQAVTDHVPALVAALEERQW